MSTRIIGPGRLGKVDVDARPNLIVIVDLAGQHVIGTPRVLSTTEVHWRSGMALPNSAPAPKDPALADLGRYIGAELKVTVDQRGYATIIELVHPTYGPAYA